MRKKRPKECNHNCPTEKEMNEGGQGILVCSGIAEARGLSETGYRGKLSSFLPKRNCPWTHGTMKAVSILLGSNSDFQSSDRLPIIAETHETCCVKTCADVEDLDRLLLAMQLLQNQLRGYFGGYMANAITLGDFEEMYLNDSIAQLQGTTARNQ